MAVGRYITASCFLICISRYMAHKIHNTGDDTNVHCSCVDFKQIADPSLVAVKADSELHLPVLKYE